MMYTQNFPTFLQCGFGLQSWNQPILYMYKIIYSYIMIYIYYMLVASPTVVSRRIFPWGLHRSILPDAATPDKPAPRQGIAAASLFSGWTYLAVSIDVKTSDEIKCEIPVFVGIYQCHLYLIYTWYDTWQWYLHFDDFPTSISRWRISQCAPRAS